MLPALASPHSPLQGWPHHEYAHSGLSQAEKVPLSSIGQTPWQPGRPQNIPSLLIPWLLMHC